MSEFALAVGNTFPWHEVYGPSDSVAAEFYVKALDWEIEDYEMGPEMGVYKMLKANGTAVAGIQATAGNPQMEGVPPHWATYIAVDDVDARLAKCIAAGGKCVVDPMDIPNVGRMALVSDPQGAHFWIYKSASPG